MGYSSSGVVPWIGARRILAQPSSPVRPARRTTTSLSQSRDLVSVGPEDPPRAFLCGAAGAHGAPTRPAVERRQRRGDLGGEVSKQPLVLTQDGTISRTSRTASHEAQQAVDRCGREALGPLGWTE